MGETKESDVYGMGMVIFEASSHHPVSPGSRVKSQVDLLGLDREQAVLQVHRRHCIVESTGWGISSAALRRNL